MKKMKCSRLYLLMNKDIFLITIITLSFWFLIDFVFGKKILKLTEAEWWRAVDIYNVPELLPSIEITDVWGSEKYKLCSDKSGFKTSCKNKNKLIKNYKLAIIGDSNIEAVGLNHESSLVGLIEEYKNFDVANLAIQSYSPTIYLKKIKTLLDNGYKFNHIIVFIDPSDLVDEADYQLVNDKIFIGKNNKTQKTKKFLKNIFPFTYKIAWYFKKFYLTDENNLNNCEIREKCNSRWSWSIKDHGKVGELKLSIKEASDKLINNLEELNLILKKNKIKFSVGIYPYPSHLKYDNANSKYKEIIENFCIKKNYCNNFFDLYTPLFQMYEINKTIINEIYFEKDVHFNKTGNKILFEILKSKYDGAF